ncbi:MAG: NAD(P)H-binding protein [Candidatus Eremiobacteraeota bacterium]|nr:NAD(P)H-binding protein [Candidatus Eremiobacteraeota bacterium]
MKIVLFGASGMIGSRILTEALSRGHVVTAVVRSPDKIDARPNLCVVKGDATDAASIAATAAGAELAISAYSPQAGPQDDLSKNATALLAGLAEAHVPRVIVVGGAGSLETEPGKYLVDSPSFPAAYKARATAQKAALEIFRASSGSPVTWTFVSPAAIIAPGARTGTFRTGDATFMVDANGESKISAEDYAVAILDEAERPASPNRQMSVAY